MQHTNVSVGNYLGLTAENHTGKVKNTFDTRKDISIIQIVPKN